MRKIIEWLRFWRYPKVCPFCKHGMGKHREADGWGENGCTYRQETLKSYEVFDHIQRGPGCVCMLTPDDIEEMLWQIANGRRPSTDSYRIIETARRFGEKPLPEITLG